MLRISAWNVYAYILCNVSITDYLLSLSFLDVYVDLSTALSLDNFFILVL